MRVVDQRGCYDTQQGNAVSDGRATEGTIAAIDDPLLAAIVGRLVDTYHPDQIYLFGSRARGTSDADSDYDLMVVVPDTASPRLQRGRAAYAALWDLGTAADVLVWTRSAFHAGLHLHASLPATIVREGRRVYPG